MLDVRSGHIDGQEVGQHQLGQWMGAVLVGGPVHFPVEAVPEPQIGVQPGSVGPLVRLGQPEGVFGVVEVAYLQVPIHRIELLRGQQHVLDLWPAGALQANRQLPPGQRFTDHRHQAYATEESGAVDLDDDAEHVLAVQVDRTRARGRRAGRFRSS